MNYSNKIKFKDIKVKNSKFKLTIVNIMIFILTITAILTASYKDKVKPTTLTFNDVNKLLMDYTVTNPILYEKIKKFMPEEIFYINNINIIDSEFVNFNTINAPISITLNYPTGTVNCFATAEIQYKYKKGWFIKDFINVKTDNFIPLDTLINAVYFGDGFSFNNVNYEYTKSYIDSLYVISEEGDTSSTLVKVGSFNTGRNVHFSAILSYNFNENTWELLDFQPTAYTY